MNSGVTYDNPILVRIRELMVDKGYYENFNTVVNYVRGLMNR